MSAIHTYMYLYIFHTLLTHNPTYISPIFYKNLTFILIQYLTDIYTISQAYISQFLHNTHQHPTFILQIFQLFLNHILYTRILVPYFYAAIESNGYIFSWNMLCYIWLMLCWLGCTC